MVIIPQTATKTVSTEIIHAGHRTGLPFFTISKRVHNMRERDNSHYFVGREGLLAKLSSKLSTHGAQKRVALYGLSGIGHVTLFLGVRLVLMFEPVD
jgi:hypothetical protein